MAWFLLDTSGTAYFTIGHILVERGFKPVNIDSWAYLLTGEPSALTYLQLRFPGCTVKEISLAEAIKELLK
jgi:hypothetical protein